MMSAASSLLRFPAPPHEDDALSHVWHDGPEVAMIGATLLALATDVGAVGSAVATTFMFVLGISFAAVRFLTPSSRHRGVMVIRALAIVLALGSPFVALAGNRKNETRATEDVGNIAHAVSMFQIREGRWPNSFAELPPSDFAHAPKVPIRLISPTMMYTPPADREAAKRAALAHTASAGWYTTGPTLEYWDPTFTSTRRTIRFVPGGWFNEK